MNISWLTVRDLEYLSALAEHLHFGKAAAAVHVSQPALSAQIKKVESYFGVQLFERTQRHVKITPLGEAVVNQVRVTLREAEKIREVAIQNQDPFYGRLRLGAIATLGPYYLPHLLPLFKRKYPNLELNLKEGLTENLIFDLKAGELDVVIASWTIDDASLLVFPLFKESFELAVPKNHPFANRKSITLRDLRASEMVLLEDGHCLRDEVIDVCPRNRRGNIHSYHATSLETVRHLVAAGIGYTLMPYLSLSGTNQLEGLICYRKIAGGFTGRKIILVCRKSYAGKDIKDFASLLTRHLPPGVEILN
ncbi:MAG: LysR substrate-binding domain-containing protein [Nitrospiria bacterium]